MPLSEHEQRLLEQIERGLYTDDPKFATSYRSISLRSRTARKIAMLVLVFAVGIAMLVIGVVLAAVWLSILGFAAMFFAAVRTAAVVRHPVAASSEPARGGARPAKPAKPQRGSWTERAEERWKKRFDDPDA